MPVIQGTSGPDTLAATQLLPTILVGGTGNDSYLWRQFQYFVPGFTVNGVWVPGQWRAGRDTVTETSSGGIDTVTLRSAWPAHVIGGITAAEPTHVEIVRVAQDIIDWRIATGIGDNRIYARSG